MQTSSNVRPPSWLGGGGRLWWWTTCCGRARLQTQMSRIERLVDHCQIVARMAGHLLVHGMFQRRVKSLPCLGPSSCLGVRLGREGSRTARHPLQRPKPASKGSRPRRTFPRPPSGPPEPPLSATPPGSSHLNLAKADSRRLQLRPHQAPGIQNWPGTKSNPDPACKQFPGLPAPCAET